jgi:hypothetical protein
MDRRGYHCTQCHATAQAEQAERRGELMKGETAPDVAGEGEHERRRLQLWLLQTRFG